MVYRIYVERKENYDNEAKKVLFDLQKNVTKSITDLRIINRYDAENLSADVFEKASKTVFSEPQTDKIFYELPECENIFAIEYLPGQFDQRADSCSQCIQLLDGVTSPKIRTAKVYVPYGNLTDSDIEKIQKYLINPVESRLASLEKYETLADDHAIPETVETINGFINYNEAELLEFLKKYGLAMDKDDVKFCQAYFINEEKRDPTITEIRLIDSYWSDHCRHTTFQTVIENTVIADDYINEAFSEYLACRKDVYGDRKKNITLMDIATLGAKYLKKHGILKNLDESEEINACSVKITANIDGKEEPWILMFKNETHNHPTEIEPFGGAATCLGGAIRDPLSGRSYVYQAMRITGAADPRATVEETLKGKLPQFKIVEGAAQGYSSYGNQVGLATGLVHEIYHKNYVAKRMEVGAVVGAAPADHIVREVPSPSDVIILLGGKTGRDGCGGATGSSKSHTVESISVCGAEVQKGNPPEERKIQRLFRNKDVTRLIKRCNDFGAGGVSVAIGELADGLYINLDNVPKKYDGLDGTELAISESQERMAVVIAKENEERFIAEAEKENLTATRVATVTAEPRLRMEWKNNVIVDLSREFLNSNGAPKSCNVEIKKADTNGIFEGIGNGETFGETFEKVLSDLNICSQKGLISRFDSTIGAATVVMPHGGKYRDTDTQFMAAKLPVRHGVCDTASVMSWGYNPYISEKSPYHGAIYAVTESIAKIVAAGVNYKDSYMTFQEFFGKTQGVPSRWGMPMSALLGAFLAQKEFGIAAIGGKDSMSGTFENIDVPPTLVSFAIAPCAASKIISPEFKTAGNKVYVLIPEYDKNGVVVFDTAKAIFEKMANYIESGKVVSSYAIADGGIAEAVAKMAFGNRLGFEFANEEFKTALTQLYYGGFVVEATEDIDERLLGVVTEKAAIAMANEEICLEKLYAAWEKPLESVYKTKIGTAEKVEKITYKAPAVFTSEKKFAAPRVVIPVFPGTNCEFDTARQFEQNGGIANIYVLQNQSSENLVKSLEGFAKAIDEAQILMLPGGFSGGDEPDGSGKFITAVLRSPFVKEAVTNLIENRDGLVLGICNGFQALVKSGLLPYGKILDVMNEDAPTLTYNTIGYHQSHMIRTRIASNNSPWLMGVEPGDIHTIAISHGEGRFMANEAILNELIKNGQIATQYVDMSGEPTMDINYNPNGSVLAIEGIMSKDGRILGKMGHSERIGENIVKNIPGEKDQFIFRSGIKYFS